MIAAFALSEPEAGSDVAAMACAARRDGDDYRARRREDLDLQRRHRRCLHASSPAPARRPGTRGISAFVVFADDPGLRDRRAHRRDRAASAGAHPLRRIAAFPPIALLGAPGEGFKIAMRTLDIFRASVAAAALGFARRALDEAVAHAQAAHACSARRWPTSSSRRPRSATWRPAIDAAALLTYRAAWRRDVQRLPTTREAAMAKMTATESAQSVIDRAVQMFGGRGVQLRRDRRAALPRDPRAADLRRRDRGAEADHRARSA